MGPGGALEAAVDARAKGLARFIGITSHGLEAPAILLRALEQFDFASVLLPYNFPMMNNPKYAEGFNHLAAACREREVALQTIKAVCRRPWPEGAEHTTTTWYEALTGQDEIDKSVRYVLGRPQLFLNSASDVNLLPKVLKAARRFTAPPPDSEMRALLSSQEMLPLWQEEPHA
jgi:hypothetical protein